MPVPAVLAVAASDAAFLSIFTAFVVALLVSGAWLAARRRHRPRVAIAILVAGALLVGASFLPVPATAISAQVVGFATGEARIPVRAAEGAPLTIEGGEGRVESDASGQRLVLLCATRCHFRLGAEPAWGVQGVATLADAEDGLVVEVHGGPLQVSSIDSTCQRLPALVAWMGGGDPCLPCRTVEYLTGAGADGTLRLTASPSAAC